MGACCATLHTVKEKDQKVIEQEQQEREARQEREREEKGQEQKQEQEQEQKQQFEEIVDGKHLKYMEHHENKQESIGELE